MRAGDEMTREHHPFPLDIWIEDYLKTGITWQEILFTIELWLNERQSLEAFELLSAAIKYRGSRADLDTIGAYRTSFAFDTSQIIKDTEFSVSFRSLR